MAIWCLMRKKAAIFIIGGLAAIISIFFTFDSVFKYFEVLTRVNYIVYDAGLRVFHKDQKSDAVVIVDIDEKSLRNEGRWPWSRDKVASLVQVLQRYGAAVIVFDILFPESEANEAEILLNHAKQSKVISPKAIDYLSRQLPYFNHDKILAEAVEKSDVVLGIFFSKELYYSVGKIGKPILSWPENLTVFHGVKFIGNIPVLADSVRYAGFTTTLPDEDGVLRRSPLLVEYGKYLYPSLALEAVRAYLLADKVLFDLCDLDEKKSFLGLWLGDAYIPTDMVGNILISYVGPAFSFPYMSAADVIRGKVTAQAFEGKIVIIGSSAVGVGDLHSTPLQSAGYPGVEIHANIISSILNKSMMSSPVWLVGVERVLLVVLSFIFTILAIYFSILGLLVSTLLMMFSIFMVNAILFIKWNWILPHLILPYLQVLFLGVVNSAYGYLFEIRYRKKLRDIYGQYVSSGHIDRMMESRAFGDSFDGSSKVMTVLFADIQNFTSISEKLDAKGVKKFLNTLLTPLTEIIFESRGTIDKYVGDMIMAFWNDPIDDSEHALNGVKAALLMQEKIQELSSVFAEQNIFNVAIRIGVNTGMMQVGDMGSKYRKAYTVLGDAVNLGSRLEGVNKIYGTKILVSQDTKERCCGVIFRFIDSVYVKGKEKPTNVYEPLCLLGSEFFSLEAELSEYNKVLELYNINDWSGAKEGFAKLAAKYPEVELYAIYLQRVSQYEINPPPVGWDHGQHLITK